MTIDSISNKHYFKLQFYRNNNKQLFLETVLKYFNFYKIFKSNMVIFHLLVIFNLISNCSSMSSKDYENKIIQHFQSSFLSSKQSKSAVLLVHSDRLGIHINSAAGEVSNYAVDVAGQSNYLSKQKIQTIPTKINQTYHIASVGKLFTATLILQLVEKNKLSLDDKVQDILSKRILENLFVLKAVDYSSKVTIRQLLNHTSGIADYFESTNPNKKAVIDDITLHPDKFWTPMDLLDFTRNKQEAVSIPGEEFHYSDTGYILLGLVIEKVENKSFEKILSENIFQPLRMNSSYMHLRSKPIQRPSLSISPILLGDQDVTDFKSISSDWAGGGIVSTTYDLLLFHKALIEGKLISKANYESMKGNYQFMDGIEYGLGMMTVDFGKMSFFIPSIPKLHGHSGILGTLLFYSPDFDTHIIVNLGNTDDVGESFEMMYWILSEIEKINELEIRK